MTIGRKKTLHLSHGLETVHLSVAGCCKHRWRRDQEFVMDTPVLAEKEGNERSCLASHGHTTSPALDLFDPTSGTKSECLVGYSKVMKTQPAQETAEQ